MAIWGLVAVAWLTGPLRALEGPVADIALKAAHLPPPTHSPVAAVVIDDEDLKALGPLPLNRGILASIVRSAQDAGARAVILDILLTEPGVHEEDQALATALSRGPSLTAAALDEHGSWLLPLPMFGGPGRAGHVHGEVDRDGVIRTFLSSKQSGGTVLPALSYAAASLGGWRGSLRPGAPLRPGFSQPPSSIPTISALHLLRGEEAGRSLLTGRLVFVGYGAAGAGDRFVVPRGGNAPSPGVLVHASVTSSILRGDLLSTLRPATALLLSALLSAAATAIRSRTDSAKLPPLLGLGAAVCGAGPLAIRLWGIVLPEVLLLSGLAATSAVREAIELRAAHEEAGKILESLVESRAPIGRDTALRGIRGRLQMVRTLQKQLLHESELRRTLLEGLQEGVILWNHEGRPVMSNGAAARLWGDVPPRQTLAGVPSVGESREGENARTIRRGERTLEVEIRPTGVWDLGLIRDVSVREQLERRRREMQRLVSHELKTPLASIAGFAEMLGRYSVSEEELSRVAGLIQREAERLGEMVRAFLDLEGLSSGLTSASTTLLELARVVEDRCEILRSAAEAGGSRLVVTARDAGLILGNRQLLDRLVDNLISNAIKHSPPGGTVRISVERPGDEVILTVQDDGDGIPADAQPHVFERFYRVPGDTTAGSGLGLAFVQEITKAHHGSVGFESEPGQGATFFVTLPAAGAASGGEDPDGEAHSGR